MRIVHAQVAHVLQGVAYVVHAAAALADALGDEAGAPRHVELIDELAVLRVGDELDVEGRARLVAQGIGQRGRCVDYIRNTLEHMRELGVHDPHLTRILETALDLSTGAKDK